MRVKGKRETPPIYAFGWAYAVPRCVTCSGSFVRLNPACRFLPDARRGMFLDTHRLTTKGPASPARRDPP